MTCSAALTEFTRTLDALIARHLPPERLMELLAPEFGRLVLEPDLLDAAAQMPRSDRYAQHVLHRCPGGGASLVSLVWRPYDRTPVHDHRAWGLAAVYRGCERETQFTWDASGTGAARLRPVESRIVVPGEVLPIVPPDDIHRVENPDRTPTVSLHLYGCDVLAADSGSSVRRVYGPADLFAEPSRSVALVH
jgi:predicted metal-dependent enzyme (double-stranded beta helix superfamily)